MEPAGDSRVRQVGGVEPHDRRCNLSERDPEPAPVRAERHVVRLRTDVDAVGDPPLREVDHGDRAAAAVRDVGIAVSRGDPRNLRIAEAVEDLERSERVPAEQRHRPVRIEDDGRAVQRRRDHQRVREANTLEDVAAVRAERDGKNLVRGLGRDERDGAVLRRVGGRGRNEQEHDGKYEESAHATLTARPNEEVP